MKRFEEPKSGHPPTTSIQNKKKNLRTQDQILIKHERIKWTLAVGLRSYSQGHNYLSLLKRKDFTVHKKVVMIEKNEHHYASRFCLFATLQKNGETAVFRHELNFINVYSLGLETVSSPLDN